MNLRLKNKMIFLIGLPILLGIIALCVISYVYSDKMVLDMSGSMLSFRAKNHTAEISAILERNLGFVDSIVYNFGDDVTNYDKIHQKLTYLTNTVPDNSGYYIGYEDKTYRDGSGWVPDASWDVTSRPWYIKAKASKESIVSTPYFAPKWNKVVITISKRVEKDGKFVGALGTNIQFSQIENLVKNINFMKSGKAILLDAAGNYIVDEKYGLEDNIKEVENGKYAQLGDKLLSGKDESFVMNTDGQDIFYQKNSVPGTDWIFVLKVPKAEVQEISKNLTEFMTTIAVITIAIITFIIFFVAKSIVNPIAKVHDSALDLANYDLTKKQDTDMEKYLKNGDEIAEMANAIIKVKDAFRDSMQNIKSMSQNILQSSNTVMSASSNSAEHSEKIANIVTDVSKAAVSQAEDVEKGSKTIQIMEEALMANKDIVSRLNETSVAVYDAGTDGLRSMDSLTQTNREVEDSTAAISDVTKKTNESVSNIESATEMITQISDRTNLLALNAAIEAARAGEAGKGFAVVADEVRELADQSSSFAKEITGYVHGLMSNTLSATEAIDRVSETVKKQTKEMEETKIFFNEIMKQLDKNKEDIKNLNNSEQRLLEVQESISSITENLSAISEQTAASMEETSEISNKQVDVAKSLADEGEKLNEAAKKMQEIAAIFKL